MGGIGREEREKELKGEREKNPCTYGTYILMVVGGEDLCSVQLFIEYLLCAEHCPR